MHPPSCSPARIRLWPGVAWERSQGPEGGASAIRYLLVPQLGPTVPSYLALPNMDSPAVPRPRHLTGEYAQAPADTVRDDGYAITVIRFVRRGGIDTAVASADVATRPR